MVHYKVRSGRVGVNRSSMPGFIILDAMEDELIHDDPGFARVVLTPKDADELIERLRLAKELASEV